MDIKVVYALRDRQWFISLNAPEVCTLEQALILSKVLNHVAPQDRSQLSFGINGRVKPSMTLLREGDRVEVYRPRLVNPKEQRRQQV
ncbi:MAG: RnfH family protein [Ferrovum sp. 37-45-19]|uniref:RnfH family protein n=1 Tax=Ferrovum sp. JA12 TaxID=1356299 RepID=UPI000703364C|nr:RnfH family protein [Ferrovum sp. JA12]OYV79081.1 MAG: RnfH family protein [Ferrovum sp. 21-44-67]OYV93682.1 MAG: RnfH family protein [Ferrovum sp. 37-45-19]OZB31659.1 MAG: RnfH family protein [Ferrovum sp. 34-44-207]HQT82170.1 RnfH family protein [Ferrovaceae bacterium]KRH78418.1 persistence and stress-resistance antitoxin PasI [Ferrovum sp. JA12]